MRNLIHAKWEEKIEELLGPMSFLKMFVSTERLEGIRDRVVDIFTAEAENYTEQLVKSLETKIDLRETIRKNILAFDVQRLSDIIEEIGYREMNEIALIGGVLGIFIGLIQAAVNFAYFRAGQ
jgi:uncharacterized membrane protein YheB (UPF0754 family)